MLLVTFLLLLLLLLQIPKLGSKKPAIALWSAPIQASCHSYLSQWWHTAKQGWKVPTHFVYLGVFEILFLPYGRASLLRIFNPDHVLKEYAKKNLKKLFITVLLLAWKKCLWAAKKVYTSYHLCTSSLLPCCKHSKRGFFPSPTTWALSTRQVCSVPPCFFHTDEGS